MSFGKQDAPDPPNYQPIAQASEKAAQLQYNLGQQQLDWAREQYAQYWPYVQSYLTSQTGSTEENRQRALDYYDFYKDTYKPIEQQYAQTALGWATPARMEQRAGAAMKDVAESFEASRRATLNKLESFGIDPSQTRFGALDFGSRIAQAAATAAAGTLCRLNTEGVGLSLMGAAIDTGRGYPANISSAYSTATQAGYLGNKSGSDLYGTGAGAMGSPTGYFSGGTGALNAWGNALNQGFNNQFQAVQYNNQQAANTWNGIGKLAGGALGFVL